MLAKENRLKKKNDFDSVFKNSKTIKNSFFIFKIAKNNLKTNRFGFIVSQKISKKAIIRNKVKRRLSEAVKSGFENLKTGYDIILMALPGIEKQSFIKIKDAIEKTLKCLNL